MSRSYGPLLRKALRALPESPRILEWGPGESTRIMLEERPAARIVTIEHQRDFADAARVRFPRVHVVRCPIPVHGPSQYDAWPALRSCGGFDLVFVDGRRRVACLLTARHVVRSDGGVVLLHDCQRPEYKLGMELFHVEEIFQDTVWMELP